MSRIRIACLAAAALALTSAPARAQAPDPEFAKMARLAAQARAMRAAEPPGATDSLRDFSDTSLPPAPTSIIQPYGTWKMVPPPILFGASTVLDPVGDRIVVAGGSNGYFQKNVWTLSLAPGSRWQVDSLASAQAPGAVAYAATAYDPVHARMVLFGGLGHGSGSQAAASNEVWSLRLGSSLTWSRPIVEGTPPSPRWNAAATYDSRRNRLLVYGGEDAFGPFQDTWALDLGDTLRWTLLAPADSIPPARTQAAAVYDSNEDRLLVYGGVTQGERRIDFSQELWSLSLGDTLTWRKLGRGGSLEPFLAVNAAAAFDAARRRLILLGGLDRFDTWLLDLNGDPTWQRVNGRRGFDRQKFTALDDAVHDRILCVGGTASAADESDVDVLSLADPSQWSLLGARPRPTGRAFAVTMFDSRRMRMILFSGWGSDDDTWAAPMRDLAAWTRLATASPPPRFIDGIAGAYDPIGDRCLVLGLVYRYHDRPQDELWSLSLSDTSAGWEKVEVPGGALPDRSGHSMIYDPPRHRLIVFGGYPFLGRSDLNDVWALSLDAPTGWTQIHTPGPAPLPRDGHTAVYDPVHDWMLVQGGNIDSYGAAPFRTGDIENGATLWALQLDGLPIWKAIHPEGSIPALEGATLVFDSVHQRMLLHGGRAYGSYGDQFNISTWGLNLEPELRWEYLITTGDPATGSWGGSAAYDPTCDRLVVFGGYGITGMKNDLWTLDFAPDAAPRPAWLVSAKNDAGAVSLVWGCREGAGTAATVYRRGPAGAWSAIATVQADAQGEIHFTDTAPENRWTETYRLGVTANGATTYSADATLPLQLTRAPLLARAYPNPARAESFQVDFQLPSAHPARLDLVDVRGRVVWSGAVSASGPGPESFRVSARPRSGVYWLHLTQDGQEATLKTVVLQ